MRLVIDGWPTRQNEIEFVVQREVLNDFRPSRGVPQFFAASRAGMQNHVRTHDFPIAPKSVSCFARCSRKIELRSQRSSTDAKWLKQSKIVVDCVHIPHTDSNKISVNPSARLGLLADAVRGNPSARS